MVRVFELNVQGDANDANEVWSVDVGQGKDCGPIEVTGTSPICIYTGGVTESDYDGEHKYLCRTEVVLTTDPSSGNVSVQSATTYSCYIGEGVRSLTLHGNYVYVTTPTQVLVFDSDFSDGSTKSQSYIQNMVLSNDYKLTDIAVINKFPEVPSHICVDYQVGSRTDLEEPWEHAYETLQGAIDKIKEIAYFPGREIWIATNKDKPDAYQGSYDLGLSNVSIYGGFRGDEKNVEDTQPSIYPTIIMGSINKNIISFQKELTLSGITIDGGWDPDKPQTSQSLYGIKSTTSGAKLTVKKCKIENCQKGVNLNGCDLAEFKNTDFLNNGRGADIPVQGGGIQALSCGGLALTGCCFSHNRAQSGGALDISIMSESIVSIKDTTFQYNDAEDGSGGGIHASQCILQMDNCTFSHNSASDKGGAIYADNVTSQSGSYVSNVRFSDNRARLGGGGYFFDCDDIPISNCGFINNLFRNPPAQPVRIDKALP
jgi:predicted outer membrane repeat protein